MALTATAGTAMFRCEGEFRMTGNGPRGIAVIDAGSTNTKIVLFDHTGAAVAVRKTASRHVEGPPYRHIDPEPMVAFAREILPELDRFLPIDAVVPCAHGAALACLAADGSLALPVMDYTAAPPPEVVAEYRKIGPPFSEVFAPLLPMALTHALQLYWQERDFPEGFRRIATVIPWIQYVGFRLCGIAAGEISGMSAQSHLMDVRHNRLSSLVRRRGWERLFPPMVKAWEEIGALKPEFRGPGFRGAGRVLAGVHDSTANYLRYRAGGLGRFTLLSTGTWIIAFDSSTPVERLDAARDTATNTDVFGRPVACSRFYGGHEFDILTAGAAGDAASIADAARLVAAGIFALPSFTDSGGPVPGSGGKGRITGGAPADAAERAALASLYCALMVSEQLNAVGSRHDIIVDGPFARNAVFLGLLAALRERQNVRASNLRDGTTAGAACLALMPMGRLPHVKLDLSGAAPASIGGLAAYRSVWRKRAGLTG